MGNLSVIGRGTCIDLSFVLASPAQTRSARHARLAVRSTNQSLRHSDADADADPAAKWAVSLCANCGHQMESIAYYRHSLLCNALVDGAHRLLSAAVQQLQGKQSRRSTHERSLVFPLWTVSIGELQAGNLILVSIRRDSTGKERCQRINTPNPPENSRDRP